MRLKSLKKLSFLMSVVMVMTFLVFPMTSGASEKRDGKIVFKEAELKELELTSDFKEKFSIDASVEKAKFAFINDKTPGYFIVTVRDSELVRTPLELKSDGKGNLYSEISYEKESTSILPYDIIAVDSALDPLNTQLSCDPNYFSIDSGIRSLYNYYIDWSTDLLELSKLDRGVPGKIKFKCIMSEHCPFKSLSYKTAKDGEYKELSFKGRDSEYIDLKSKYFAFKYELKDYYEIEGSELLVDGIPTPVIGEREGDSYIFEDITMSVHSTEDPLKDCGYIFVFGSFFIFPDNDSGITYTEPSAGDVSYKLNLNKEEDKVLSGDVTINDLIVKNGELIIFGVDEGVTPYNLIVKGTNKISYLIFNTPVTVTCEPGATLAFDKFNYEDPDTDNPKPDFDYKLGENTVYDKEARMFKSGVEPTEVPKPTVTATPTPVATATATPTPTVVATATATPTPEATATPTPVPEATATATPAVVEASVTPSATPTVAAEEPKTDGPAATDGKVVTVKSYVYKVNQDNTASLQAVNPKDKNVSLPASIKVNGKSVKVTTIEANAFKNSKAQNVTLGKYVKKISSYAFSNCKKLISVKANANLQAIEANAFSKCPKFRSFDISKAKKIKTINAKAFSGVKTAKLKVQIAKKAKKKIVPALIKAKVKKSNIKVK